MEESFIKKYSKAAAVILGLVFVLWLILFVIKNIASADIQYPNYSNYVNDYANVIPDDLEKTLNTKLSAYDQKTHNQIAILTVETTKPDEIEEYSIHVADKWKPGQKGKDNGVLMTFAMKDRKMRIEVGRGLEGELTDLESKHIINDMTPYFKQSKYFEGINTGVNEIIAGIGGELAGTQSEAEPSGFVVFIVFLVILILIILIIAALAYSPYTTLGGAGAWGFGSSSGGDSDGFGGFGGGGFSGGGSSGGW